MFFPLNFDLDIPAYLVMKLKYVFYMFSLKVVLAYLIMKSKYLFLLFVPLNFDLHILGHEIKLCTLYILF